MTRAPSLRVARGALCALAASALVLACSSPKGQNGRGDGGPAPERVMPAPAPTPAAPPSQAKPFLSCFEAIEKPYFQTGTFPIGQKAIWGRIHSGPHATLFFMATRGKGTRHIHAQHEETVFFYSGTGELLLAEGRKPKRIEAGYVVRIPPGVCHGFSGDHDDPLKGIVVTSPSWAEPKPDHPEDNDYVDARDDAPGVFQAALAIDASDPVKTIAPLPPLPKGVQAQPYMEKKILDDTTQSTLAVAAVRHYKIPDHHHEHHDEIVMIFAQKGRGYLRLGGDQHIVDQSAIAYIPEGCPHSFEHVGEGHSRAVSIYAEGGGAKDMKLDDENAALKAGPVLFDSEGRGEAINVGPGQGAVPDNKGDDDIHPKYSPERPR